MGISAIFALCCYFNHLAMVRAVCSYLCLAVFHIFFDFYSPHFQYVLPNLVFQLQLQWCLLQDKVQSSPSFLNLHVHIMPFFL